MVSNVIPKNLSYRFDSIGKPGGQDDKIIMLLALTVEHHRIICESRYVLLLKPDASIDDSFASAGVVSRSRHFGCRPEYEDQSRVDHATL